MCEPVMSGKRARLQPIAVLPDSYETEFERTNVFVSPITDKTATSGLVALLSKEFPLQGMHHLKRVRQNGATLEIILCTKDEDLCAVSALEGIDKNQIRQQQVPRHAPLTRMQFEKSSLLWPTQFHENKELERILDGTFFNPNELNRIESHMRTAVGIYVESGQADGNAVLVVNPASDRILAMATPCLAKHPVLHATMVALDLVARLQGGGAWETGLPVQQVEEKDRVPLGESAPYIATGYDVYMLREPCPMCAMALVHSRVRRVFYGASDPIRGSLGSRFKMHCLGGLNHSFKVWRNIIADECQRALSRVTDGPA